MSTDRVLYEVMTRARPATAVFAAAFICSAATLPAQIPDAARTAQPDQTPIAPFAVVHPIYVPSPSAIDGQPPAEDSAEPQPRESAPSRARLAGRRPVQRAQVAATAPAAAEADGPAVAETPTALPPPLAAPRRIAPVATGQPHRAPSPVVMSPRDASLARLLAAGAAVLLAALGLALWRRHRGKAQFAGAVAKTPTWQAVMPPDLTVVSDDDQPVAKSLRKRLGRGGTSGPAGPMAAKGRDASPEAASVADGPHIVRL